MSALVAWPMMGCDEDETGTNIPVGGVSGAGGDAGGSDGAGGTPPRPMLPTGGLSNAMGGIDTMGGNANGGDSNAGGDPTGAGGNAMGGDPMTAGGAMPPPGGAAAGGAMAMGGESGAGGSMPGGNMGVGGLPQGSGGFGDDMGGQPAAGGDPQGMGGDPGMGGAPPPVMARRGELEFVEKIRSDQDPRRGSEEPELRGSFKRFDRVPAMPMPADVAGDCVLLREGANDPGDFVRVGAGNIEFSGTYEFTMHYNERAGGYGRRNVTVVDDDAVYDLWDGMGTPITLNIAGSEHIGALATGDIASPQDIADMVPAPDGTLSRAGDSITWTPGNGAVIEVEILAGGVNERIVCQSDDDGSVDIPAAAFAWLPAEAPANGWRVNLTRRVEFTGQTAAPETDISIHLERISYSQRITLED